MQSTTKGLRFRIRGRQIEDTETGSRGMVTTSRMKAKNTKSRGEVETTDSATMTKGRKKWTRGKA